MSKGNLFMGYATGKVGSLVLSRVNGQEVQRAYNAKPKNPKSVNQQTQRSKLSNLVNFYNRGKKLLNHSFTNRKTTNSSYNAFVAANMAASAIHLTAQEAANKASIVFPYIISDGVLPAIELVGSGNDVKTSIVMGNGIGEIADTTTIAEFSKEVIENNPEWIEGDQLTYVSIQQKINPSTNAPYANFSFFELDLDTNNATPLRDIMPPYAIDIVDGFVGHGYNAGEAGFAWIHSRKGSAGLQCSRQFVSIIENSILDKYTTPAQLQAALDSYSANAEYMLVPDGDVTATALEQQPEIISVKIGTTILESRDTGIPVAIGSNALTSYTITGELIQVENGADIVMQWTPSAESGGTAGLLIMETPTTKTSTEIKGEMKASVYTEIASGDKGTLWVSISNTAGQVASRTYRFGV